MTKKRAQLLYKAMERLARSSWGSRGTGRVPTVTTRWELLNYNLAIYPKNNPNGDLMSLTLKGWQELEGMRIQKNFELLFKKADK